MSWVDRYDQNLIITCGDGRTYTLWTLPKFTKEIEYHGTDFQFVDLDGELVKKRKIKGRSFPLEFFFVGENHLDEANAFETSAANPNPWTIIHPYYDTLLVQILSLKFDDSDGNVTKVTGLAKETIRDGTEVVNLPDQKDFIQLKRIEIEDLIANTEVELMLSQPEIDTIKQTTERNYRQGVTIIQDPIDAENYFNAFNQAQSTINNITASPIIAMQALVNVITAPAQFQANVKDRVRVLLNSIDNLNRTLSGLFGVGSKNAFQLQGSAMFSALCSCTTSPLEGDYNNPNVAVEISNQINTYFKNFETDLGNIQSPNGGSPDFFVPSFNVSRELKELVSLTASALYEIALNGRKEISFVLTEDSNVILLTHRFYGMDANDNNISEFIDNNQINYKQIVLGIPKNTTVRYFV